MPKEKESKSIEDTMHGAHTGHEHHLCELVNRREMDKVAKLSKDARYICLICGRVAKSATNLCLPVEIK